MDLARALINLRRDNMGKLELDWAYQTFANPGYLTLLQRLEALGWTGKERLASEEKDAFEKSEGNSSAV